MIGSRIPHDPEKDKAELKIDGWMDTDSGSLWRVGTDLQTV